MSTSKYKSDSMSYQNINIHNQTVINHEIKDKSTINCTISLSSSFSLCLFNNYTKQCGSRKSGNNWNSNNFEPKIHLQHFFKFIFQELDVIIFFYFASSMIISAKFSIKRKFLYASNWDIFLCCLNIYFKFHSLIL